MANIHTAVSATATNTQAEDTTLNPVTTASTTGDGGGSAYVAHITLQFRGIDVDPNTIYDMVNSAYGTVATVKANMARRCYIFQIET